MQKLSAIAVLLKLLLTESGEGYHNAGEMILMFVGVSISQQKFSFETWKCGHWEGCT